MSADSNYSQQPVPLAARKSALALSVVMLGLTFFSASMWTGGTLGTGLSYDDFFLAVLLGNLMLGLYTPRSSASSARAPAFPPTCWRITRSAARAPGCPRRCSAAPRSAGSVSA